MKLKLIKNLEFKKIECMSFFNAIILDDSTIVCLTKKNENLYILYIANIELETNIELDYIKRTSERNYPVLLKHKNGFSIVPNINVLYYYKDIHTLPEIINIQNKTIPIKAQLRNKKSITDSNLHPICFEFKYYYGDARNYGELEFNLQKKNAEWVYFSKIETKTFLHYKKQDHAPKINSLKIHQNKIFAFVSGGSTTSVNKWGMDYFGLVEISKKGEVLETLISSENLKIGTKKKGVHGVFTESEFVILTQHFKSDAWKGKQKLYSLKSKEYLNIELPRGFAKYRIAQIYKDFFWIYLYERGLTRIALCKKQ